MAHSDALSQKEPLAASRAVAARNAMPYRKRKENDLSFFFLWTKVSLLHVRSKASGPLCALKGGLGEDTKHSVIACCLSLLCWIFFPPFRPLAPPLFFYLLLSFPFLVPFFFFPFFFPFFSSTTTTCSFSLFLLLLSLLFSRCSSFFLLVSQSTQG